MTRKIIRPASVTVGGLTLALVLTACADSNEVDSVEAQDGAALQELLLTDGESGLTGATGVNDTVLEGETIPLVVVAEAEKFEGACGEALQAAESAELGAVGSAARTFQREDGTGVAVAQFSTDTTDISPAQLYNDIAEACEEPLKDEETGAEYTFTPLESDVSGFIFDITVTPGNESSSIMMLKDLGHHHILVAGVDADEADVKAVFDAQVAKTEQGLREVAEQGS